MVLQLIIITKKLDLKLRPHDVKMSVILSPSQLCRPQMASAALKFRTRNAPPPMDNNNEGGAKRMRPRERGKFGGREIVLKLLLIRRLQKR